MEKRQAKDYIKEVLNQSFNPERFELFIRNLLNDIEQRDNSYSGNLIPEAFRDHIAHYKRIGKYTDPEGEELDILIIQTRSVKKLERTRTALRNFVVRHLKTFDKQYALAAFYSKEDDGAEWRFSLVKIDYETKKGEKGKIKVEEELVPAKRFSFLVGKYEDAHTAQKQLLPILTNDHANPLIVKETDGDGSIEGAFSIQKVTDEFYEQYHDLYEKLANDESFTKVLDEEELDKDRFIKKLLGQIVFLYFLQKKGWLGVPKDQKMGDGSKRFLQKRFEHAQKNRENYYNDFLRYLFYEALAKEHNDEGVTYYFKRLGCRIPFLNGGLFEANFDWEHTDFTISNDLFRNEDKNKAGDKGTGILDVFDRYNFTIKEDEPLEKEVAVDPEMLGKVFENMLDIKERKSKGAYYTPREIVHYMCQESLIHYLDNSINDYTESYQPLGSDQSSMFEGSSDRKGNLNLEIENKGDIRVPKDDIEIFIRKGHLVLENEELAQNARNRIDKGEIKTTTHESILPESISNYASSLDEALESIKICDPAIGSGAFPVGLLHEIVTARQVLNSFLQREGYNSYNLKRHAIQESIYGVDIDASAIDIARLRLWLSMIVDEEDYDTIDALPNLDYKIVQGNALIGLPENAMRDLEVEEKLEELKERFFVETDEIEKKKLRSEINTKIRELLNSAEEFAGYEIDFDFKIYFSEIWHHNNGFDVIIGNPPYGETIKNNKSYYRNNFESAEGKFEIYKFFIEKGVGLKNPVGCLTYITPDTWINLNYFKKLRQFLIENFSISLITKTLYEVFENATVDNLIFVIDSNFKRKTKLVESNLNSFEHINLKYLDDDYTIILKEDCKIIDLIDENKYKVEDYCETWQGLIAYGKKSQPREWTSDKKETELHRKLLYGGDISQFNIEWSGEYLKYGKWLHRSRPEYIYKKDHILIQRIRNPKLKKRIIGAIDREYHLNGTGSSNIILKKGSKFSLEELLCILNSEVINFWFSYYFFDVNIKPTQLAKIPLPKKGCEVLISIERMLEYLIDKNELQFSFFKSISNAIVYELYFENIIRESNKQIVKFLDRFSEISLNESDEIKSEKCQREFDRLYDPNHPVRNNLETLDSIEEVRVIKETLK